MGKLRAYLWTAAVVQMMAGSAAIGQELSQQRITELEHLVIQDCGSCHGLTLKGGLGRAITPEIMKNWDAGVLRDVILDGIPGTAMPPWRPLLTEAEASWIADYLRGDAQAMSEDRT